MIDESGMAGLVPAILFAGDRGVDRRRLRPHQHRSVRHLRALRSDLGDGAVMRGGDGVLHLHRFQDEQRLPLDHHVASHRAHHLDQPRHRRTQIADTRAGIISLGQRIRHAETIARGAGKDGDVAGPARQPLAAAGPQGVHARLGRDIEATVVARGDAGSDFLVAGFQPDAARAGVEMRVADK